MKIDPLLTIQYRFVVQNEARPLHVKRVDGSAFGVDQGSAAFVILMGKDEGLCFPALVSNGRWQYDGSDLAHKSVRLWSALLCGGGQDGKGKRQQDRQLHRCELADLFVRRVEDVSVDWESSCSRSIRRLLICDSSCGEEHTIGTQP